MKCKTITLMMMFVLSNYLASAQEMKVAPGTNIKVETGTTLNISAGNLVLESNASGDATVIALGSITYESGSSAIVQRYMPGAIAAWHLISSPVTGMAITASNWAPGSDEDLFLWLEPSPGTWVNYKNTTSPPTFATANPGDDFVTGRGYLADYNTANLTNNFTGPLKTGNVTINLVKSDGKAWNWAAGWNLIGNPYASGLDWSAVVKTGLAEAYAQVYNSNKAGGAGFDQVTTIASGQGFFVQAATNGATLNLLPSQQVHTTSAVYLKDGAADDGNLVLRLSGGSYFDETKIIINEASLKDHDFWDATKINSFDTQVPQINTLIEGSHPLTINAIPAISSAVVIPVSIKVPADGNMTIELKELSGTAFEGQTVMLHDVLTNTMQTLNDNPVYHFDASVNDNPDRFLLKFGAVGVAEMEHNTLLNAYMSGSLLYVLNPDASKAQVELFNIRGQLVLSKEIGQGLQSMYVDVATGAYIVMMQTDQAITTRKIFIQQ